MSPGGGVVGLAAILAQFLTAIDKAVEMTCRNRRELTLEAAEDAAKHLGCGIADSKLLATGTAEELRDSLKSVLPSIATVYLAGENQSFLEVVRAEAREFECESFVWKDGIQSKVYTASAGVKKSIKTYRICLVFAETLGSNISASETTLLLRSIVHSQKIEEVPFKRLCSLYFSHVQHEANWVNSRFMWFMFANSALIVFYAGLVLTRWQVVPLVAGIAISFQTLWLQWITISAEERMMSKCAEICLDWKRTVPHVSKYLIATPAGGDSPKDHTRAKQLMLSIPIVFI